MGVQGVTNNIIVIDLETTGLDGYKKGDRIVEIGAANVDFQRKTVTPIFGHPIYHDKLTPEQEDSFIFHEGHMIPEECYHSPIDEEKAAMILATILDGEYVTSYNTEFDLDKFIYPWFDEIIPDVLDFGFFRAPCIMKAAGQVMPEGLWPSLKVAYSTLIGTNRKYHEHRALDDAVMAGTVLLALYQRGLYDPDREDEY